MKTGNQYLKIFSILIVVLGIGFFFNRATAQQDKNGEGAIRYLEEQFSKQNIPVVAIKILREDPLQLEIFIQSESDSEKGTPQDPINFHMVRREVTLAQRHGYIIDRITRIFLNKNGLEVSKSDVSIKSGDIVLLDLPPAKIDEAGVVEMALGKMDSLEIPLVDLSVSSMDGFQTLHIIKFVNSLEEANNVTLEVVGNLRSFVDDLNKKGAQIVMTRLEVKNESGDFYFNYLLDTQTKSEVWWMADGFDDSWFPHP